EEVHQLVHLPGCQSPPQFKSVCIKRHVATFIFEQLLISRIPACQCAKPLKVAHLDRDPGLRRGSAVRVPTLTWQAILTSIEQVSAKKRQTGFKIRRSAPI